MSALDSAEKWNELRLLLCSLKVEDRWSAVSRIGNELRSGYRPAVEWLISQCLEASERNPHGTRQDDGERTINGDSAAHALLPVDGAAWASALSRIGAMGDTASVNALAVLILHANDCNTSEAALAALTHLTNGGTVPKFGCSDAATRDLLLTAFAVANGSEESRKASADGCELRGATRLAVKLRTGALALALGLGSPEALRRAAVGVRKPTILQCGARDRVHFRNL